MNLKKIFDSEIKSSKNSHESLIPPYPIANNCLTMLLGSTGSGKSVWINRILNDLYPSFDINFDSIIIFNPTVIYDPAYADAGAKQKILSVDMINQVLAFIKKYKLEEQLSINLAKEYKELYNLLDLKDLKSIGSKNKVPCSVNLKNFLDFYKKNKLYIDRVCDPDCPDNMKIDENNLKKFAIILDDCGDLPILSSPNSPLYEFIMKRRHYNTSIFIACQSYTQLQKKARRQVTDIVLFKGTDLNDLKIMFEGKIAYAFKGEYDLFLKMMKEHLFSNKPYVNICFMLWPCLEEDKKNGTKIIMNYTDVLKSF